MDAWVLGGRGWVEGGELKKRGLAVCVQNPCRAYPGNRLPATSTVHDDGSIFKVTGGSLYFKINFVYAIFPVVFC